MHNVTDENGVLKNSLFLTPLCGYMKLPNQNNSTRSRRKSIRLQSSQKMRAKQYRHKEDIQDMH